MKATELLKRQHREVKKRFGQTLKAEGTEERRSGMEEIAAKLTAHMAIEEEMFYPAVGELETKKSEDMVAEAYEEHHVAKLVIAELPNVDPGDERFKAKITVLSELIEHHVQEEEEEMFKVAEKLGAETLDDLGAQMEAAFNEQLGEPEAPPKAKAGRAR